MSYRQNTALRNTPSPLYNPQTEALYGCRFMGLSSLLKWCRKDPSPALPAWSIWNVGASIHPYLNPLPPPRSLKLLLMPQLSPCRIKYSRSPTCLTCSPATEPKSGFLLHLQFLPFKKINSDRTTSGLFPKT